MNDTTVSTTLRALTSSTARLLSERLRPLDLTVPQFEFLTVLAADPSLNGAAVAKAAHVSAQTGTTILHNLAIKQLITIERIRGTGRRSTLAVTECGAETLAQAQQAVADVEKQLAELLGDDAMSRLADAVTALQWRTERGSD